MQCETECRTFIGVVKGRLRKSTDGTCESIMIIQRVENGNMSNSTLFVISRSRIREGYADAVTGELFFFF